MAKLKSETESRPEFQDWDDQQTTPPDGRSTAGVSSAGTPMASGATNGQKLKLTFNGNGNSGGYGNGGVMNGHDR